MDGFWSRACAVLTLACAGALCAAAPALATDGYVSGKKWNDVNANGAKDSGEPIVKNWWVYVDIDRDGVYDAGEPSAKTGNDGSYTIGPIKWWVPNHAPRTYDVREKTTGQPEAFDGCSYPAGCKHTLTFENSRHIYTGKDFGNYKAGKLIVKKVNVGGDQADAFGFTTSGAGVSDFSLAASDAPKQFGSLKPGTYGVAETADPRYALTSATCDDGSNPSSVKVGSGETVTCTFVNTRKTGKIKVVKQLIPASDPGTFDLKVDGTTAVSGGNGANATVTVPTGTGHSVAETGATLAKYSSSLSCTDGTKGGTSAGGITVTAGATTVCTFTNTRKQGTIKVVKHLIPASDSGRFDLQVGGDVVAAGVGDAGQGSKPVGPGTYAVSEAGDLAEYRSSIACDNGAKADGTSVDVTVDSGETVICTITNTRKADLTVTKTEGGSSTLSRTWTFTLSGGPDQVALTRTTAGNPMDFGSLLPGTYTLCEIDLPDGWHSSLGAAAGGKVCTQLELAAGEAGEFTVDNTTPAIKLVKQVRRAGDAAWAKLATLQAGQTAEYLLTVTNEGVGPLVAVDVADDRCDTVPAYVGGDTDLDLELDESEAWTYRCDHVVTAGDGAEYVNTAEVTGTDKRDNPVRDTDTATVRVTTPEPPVTPEPPATPQPPSSQPAGEQQVLPEEIVSGAARLRGPSGCVSKRFKASVRGRSIQRVTFFLDGRKVKRMDAKSGQRVFKLAINPTRYGKGIHRVNARVVFKAASGTKARTLRLSFQRCARQVVAPRFTG